MGEGRKQQPQRPFKMELDQFTYGIMRRGRETQRSEGPCQSHVANKKMKQVFLKVQICKFLTPREKKKKTSKKVYRVMKLIFSYQNIPPQTF